jgi:hypothetical protein
MRGGKEHARSVQPVVPDDGLGVSGSVPTASTSGPSIRANIAQTDVSESLDTQPTGPDVGLSAGTPSESSSGSYQDVLLECNSLIKGYRKGEVSKASVYVDIQSKLAKALGNDRARTDAAFGSFIATAESHDAEIRAMTRRGGGVGAIGSLQRSPSPPISVSDGHASDGEAASKKVKVDESIYAWVTGRKDKRTVLRESLSKILKLKAYTIDPKAAKQSLINEPDCPEFPNSEWKNIICGRDVNLDAVLSGQLSTTQDDPKVEKLGDIEISYGAVQPPKWSRMEEIGISRGIEPLEPQGPQRSCSLTECTNLQVTENTSLTSLLSLIPVSTAEWLPSIKPSARGSGVSEISSSQTSRSLPISRSLTWTRSGYQSSQVPRKIEEIRKEREARTGKGKNLVTSGMRENAVKWKRTVTNCTSATSVEREDTRAKSVDRPDFMPKHPKYLECSVWTDVEDSTMFSPTACCTMTDDTLPRPPEEEFLNHDAVSTVKDYPAPF